MKKEYLERIYAGWLAKIIGIRYGAPVEGWTYEKIKNIYGELTDYPVDYREFAADDDSNGPLFYLRGLEDGGHGAEMTAQDVANALLNYAPYEHGFFWWGGYGTSTEHTAYLNLRSGIPAPRSGSIAQNGSTIAEQIGGQIFIDTWGLVAPGNPALAAKLASKAASVTHDGNALYGGIFVAVCISAAFEEKEIKKILETGLSYIPSDCEYAKIVRTVMEFYEEHPQNWRDCFAYIHANYGYDKYPGNCHIIPNIAVMILALLYGNGDFSDTIAIVTMCGWDTDCNGGNVATIIGVRNGLEGIDYDRWRKPVHDLLVCSSVIGSLNIMDIPYGALYIGKMAYELAGEELPEPWKELAEKRIHSCHFEFPGSTHSMQIRVDSVTDEKDPITRECCVCNTDESAHSGSRSLKATAVPVNSGERVFVYQKTYYEPKDFHDSRYDPCFSPLVYPGQTVHGSVMLPEYAGEADCSLYVRDLRSGKIFTGKSVHLKKGCWQELSFQIPSWEGALIGEMGVCFDLLMGTEATQTFAGLLDDLWADGTPDYRIDFCQETTEVWTGLHKEVSQFTRLKGHLYLDQGALHLSCADFGEAYTGRYDWKDYTAVFEMTPLTGENNMVNVRVQGAIRSYAVALLADSKIALLKNENGYRVLTETAFDWKAGRDYEVSVCAQGARLHAEIKEVPVGCRQNQQLQTETAVLEYEDTDHPYLQGAVGVSVRNGSHAKYSSIRMRCDS